MYCRKCGTQNDDNAYKCVQCSEVLQQAPQVGLPTQTIPNYLVQAILLTIFSTLCCNILSLPFSIVALVFSSQVNGKLQSGDQTSAADSSKKAKLWCWISFGVFLATSLLYTILYVMLFAYGAMAN